MNRVKEQEPKTQITSKHAVGTMLQWINQFFYRIQVSVANFCQSLVQTQGLSINGTWNWRKMPVPIWAKCKTGRMWKACLSRGLILFLLMSFDPFVPKMMHQRSPWSWHKNSIYSACCCKPLLHNVRDSIDGFGIILYVYYVLSHLASFSSQFALGVLVSMPRKLSESSRQLHLWSTQHHTWLCPLQCGCSLDTSS